MGELTVTQWVTVIVAVAGAVGAIVKACHWCVSNAVGFIKYHWQELKESISELKSEVKESFNEVKGEVSVLRSELSDHVRSAAEFRDDVRLEMAEVKRSNNGHHGSPKPEEMS